jgi:uncharacterized membrane protein YesL
METEREHEVRPWHQTAMDVVVTGLSFVMMFFLGGVVCGLLPSLGVPVETIVLWGLPVVLAVATANAWRTWRLRRRPSVRGRS